MCGCLSHIRYWGPGPQPGHVPWLGMEPVTLWFAGLHSIHSTIPARADVAEFLNCIWKHTGKKIIKMVSKESWHCTNNYLFIIMVVRILTKNDIFDNRDKMRWFGNINKKLWGPDTIKNIHVHKLRASSLPHSKSRQINLYSLLWSINFVTYFKWNC